MFIMVGDHPEHYQHSYIAVGFGVVIIMFIMCYKVSIVYNVYNVWGPSQTLSTL